MHFMIIAEGYDTLVTALYVKGDPFETSDAVFGVKSSLIIDVKSVEDEATAQKYGVTKGDWLIDWDFVCLSVEMADYRLWSISNSLINFAKNLLRKLWLEIPMSSKVRDE